MPDMQDLLSQLHFSSKQLKRLSKQAEADEKVQMDKIKMAIRQDNMEEAKIYAENAVRKKNEALIYLRLSSKIDSVSSKVQNAIPVTRVTKSMDYVVKALVKSINSVDFKKCFSNAVSNFERLLKQLENDEKVQKNRAKEAIQQDNMEIAKMYASRAILSKAQALKYLRMSYSLDALTSKYQSVIAMKGVSGVMKQFEDLDFHTSLIEGPVGSAATVTTTPLSQFDSLMHQVIGENSFMDQSASAQSVQYASISSTTVDENALTDRPAASKINSLVKEEK